MQTFTHHLKSASDFLDRYLPEGAAGGFFLPEKRGMPTKGEICLRLCLDWLGEVHHVVARVERTQVSWDAGARRLQGAILRLADEEAHQRDHLLAVVRASTAEFRPRGAPRRPATLRVLCMDGEARAVPGQLADLSATGALVAAERPLPPGSDVHLRLEDPARGLMHHVRGRVVRLDFAADAPRMGVEFRFQNRQERRAMGRLWAATAGAPRPRPSDRLHLTGQLA